MHTPPNCIYWLTKNISYSGGNLDGLPQSKIISCRLFRDMDGFRGLDLAYSLNKSLKNTGFLCIITSHCKVHTAVFSKNLRTDVSVVVAVKS